MSRAQFPPCPRCGTSDMARTSAAVVASGTRRTEGSQWNVGAAWADDDVIPVTTAGRHRSVQQSELARMLDLPQPAGPTGIAGCLGIGLMIMGAGITVLTFGCAMLATPSLDPAGLAVGIVIGLAVGAAVGAVPMVLGWAGISAARNGQARWQAQVAEWENARHVAGRLIYCGRDHVVYDPANAGRWMPPVNVRSYCYEQAAAEGRR